MTDPGASNFVCYLLLSIVFASLACIYMDICLTVKPIDPMNAVGVLEGMVLIFFYFILMCSWLGLQLWIIAIKSGCIGYCICALTWTVKAIFLILIALYAFYNAFKSAGSFYETQLETRAGVLANIHLLQIMMYMVILFIFTTWFFIAVILGFGFYPALISSIFRAIFNFFF